jgi:hypothetical protein
LTSGGKKIKMLIKNGKSHNESRDIIKMEPMVHYFPPETRSNSVNSARQKMGNLFTTPLIKRVPLPVFVLRWQKFKIQGNNCMYC